MELHPMSLEENLAQCVYVGKLKPQGTFLRAYF